MPDKWDRSDSPRRVACILNSRVPNADAHALQTVKMCEAFSAMGASVTLHVPRRKQTDDALFEQTLESYYALAHPVELRTHLYPDANYIRSALGLEPAAQNVLARMTFTASIAAKLWNSSADIHYTRNTFVAAALVELGLPTVFETHRIEHSTLAKHAIARMAGSAPLELVVTLTEATADALVELGVPRESIAVLPDGVDLDTYRDPPDRVEARRQLGLPQDQRLVAYTGSLDRGKGVHELVQACRLLEDVTVVVVGGREAETRRAFRSYLESEGIENVMFVCQVDPALVPRYQWAADILVVPARSDIQTSSHHPQSTSPLKLFEYMAAGRPIVATRLPGIEAVIDDGTTGLLVDPDDVDAIRSGLQHILENEALADRLARNAKDAVESYSWEARAESIYRRLD